MISAMLLSAALSTTPLSSNGTCLRSDGQIGVNLPFGSQRRADEIAEIIAIVAVPKRNEAFGWLNLMRGGNVFYEDNRVISRDRGKAL